MTDFASDLQALHEKAKPIPWSNLSDPWDGDPQPIEAIDLGGKGTIYNEGGHDEDDATLIVTLRNAAPEIIEVVKAARNFLAWTAGFDLPPGKIEDGRAALKDAVGALDAKMEA